MIQTGLVHVLAGHPVRLDLRWHAPSVPLALGVIVGHARDDPGGRPGLPRRHRPHGVGETRQASTDVSDPAGTRVIRRDADHRQCVYLVYGLAFASFKWTRIATSVACPWPYPEAKVYDPQGFYEQNGQEGPYSVGIWSGWMMAQPQGRPAVQLASDSDRCGPTMGESPALLRAPPCHTASRHHFPAVFIRLVGGS